MASAPQPLKRKGCTEFEDIIVTDDLCDEMQKELRVAEKDLLKQALDMFPDAVPTTEETKPNKSQMKDVDDATKKQLAALEQELADYTQASKVGVDVRRMLNMAWFWKANKPHVCPLPRAHSF